jgi:rubrerythrin
LKKFRPSIQGRFVIWSGHDDGDLFMLTSPHLGQICPLTEGNFMKNYLLAMALLIGTNAYADMHSKDKNREEMQASGKRGVKDTSASSQLDDLIRGEMSAVRSFDSVLEKVKDKNERQQLQAMRQDHVKAVETLKKYAPKEVKEDTKTSGPWGNFATAWTGTGKIFGDKAAVRALKTGVDHGVNEYQEALEDENITSELKDKIRTELLPRQKEQAKKLDALL